jgi:hypothetical protein
MGAFRPGVRNAPREENNPALREKHEPAPTRLRFEEDEWGGSPKCQAAAKREGLSDFSARPQLPRGPPAQMVKEQSSSEVPVESHAGTEGGSASVNLTFPGQTSRVEATFNPQAGPTGYPGPAPTGQGPMQQLWTSGPPMATGATPFPTNNAQWPQYPQYPVPRTAAQPLGIGQLVREGLIMQGTHSRTATPTQTREEEEDPQQDPRGIPQRTRLRHRQHGFKLRKGRTPISPRNSSNPSRQSSLGE